MQVAASSSRRRSYNEAIAEEEDEPVDQLDKFAESSTQAASRRLSSSNVDQLRRSSMSNGNDKGKNRIEEDDLPEDVNTKDESEVESLYDSDDESLHCAICLSVIDDRTVVQPCCHDAYCFVCILAWTEQSRRCPLCVANIELLVHNIRSEKDYQKHYLAPLVKSDSPPPERSFRELREGARRQLFNRPTHPRFKYAEWKARNKPAAMPDVDAEDLALEKRRYVYKYGLYVKHVATNRFTRFRDYSAQQVSSTPELKQRLQKWLRRELRVFDGVDLAFLVDYCTNIASQLELRSDSATRLLAEFIGEDQAEQFWHETYSFLRSPFKDIRQYDKAVQYDRPPCKLEEAKVETSPSHPATSRRVRSRSVSSVSDASPEDDRPVARRPSFTSRREDSRRLDRRSPPPRREGDSYVPSYSRLNKARPPARKRVDRRSSRDNRTGRQDKGWHRVAETREPEPSLPNKQGAAPLAAAPPPEPVLQNDSDLESIISLGESDYESAPLINPKDVTHSINKTGKEVDQVNPPALSIRGVAQAKPATYERGKEVDLIRDLGPDLLSRLSGSTRDSVSSTQAINARLPHMQASSAGGIQMKGRGFRQGRVNSEMHATLMARLGEERLRSGTVSPTIESESQGTHRSEKSEASLREHVLQVLRQRREQAVQAVASQSAPVEHQGQTITNQTSAQPDTKSSRLALLQSRLAAEKAAISPPLPSAPSSGERLTGQASDASPAVEAKTVNAEGTGDAAQRMAELKRRLAEQKASQTKA